MESGNAANYFLSVDRIGEFLRALAKDYALYIPQKDEDHLHYVHLDMSRAQEVVLGEIRATEPLKSFFFPAKEKVARYFPDNSNGDNKDVKPLAIIGPKSCDLRSLDLLDRIYKEGDFLDPTYVQKRDQSLIIACDCTSCGPSCFCPLVNVEAYPQGNFDLAMAEVEGGWVVEVGSEKGAAIIANNAGLFAEAAPEKVRERNDKRQEVKELLAKNVEEFRVDTAYEDLARNEVESPVWQETTKTCVECGACVLICPTCYCFLLADHTDTEGYSRTRTWDTCQYAGFARVAGGANPRRLLSERLRHRYLHKFDYLQDSYGFYGCTGCGRCIQACMGKIDMRKVFKEIDSTVSVGK